MPLVISRYRIINQTVLGYMIWHDLPDALAFLGILLLVGVGVFLGLTERWDAKADSKDAAAHARQAECACEATCDATASSAAPPAERSRSPAGDVKACETQAVVS